MGSENLKGCQAVFQDKKKMDKPLITVRQASIGIQSLPANQILWQPYSGWMILLPAVNCS